MKIAFMHIPKTGGISVERSLKNGLPAETKICPTYYAPDFDGKTYEDWPDFDVYQGHFDLSFLKTVPADYKRVVVLRQPRDQVLSLCNHIASREKHPLHETAKSSTLAELLNGNHSLHNMMSKHLLGKARYKELLLTKRPAKEKLAEAQAEVLANMDVFDVVGITPRLGRFIRDVSAEIDAELPAPLKENKNKFVTFKTDNLSDDDERALRFASWVDRPVYRALRTDYLGEKFEKKAQPA